jgi:hypothetical protein
MAGRDKNGRTNSRTICQQNRIAFSRLTDTLQGIKSPQLHTSTLQALGDLRDVFYEAANATNAPLFAADTSLR